MGMNKSKKYARTRRGRRTDFFQFLKAPLFLAQNDMRAYIFFAHEFKKHSRKDSPPNCRHPAHGERLALHHPEDGQGAILQFSTMGGWAQPI
jgi:hypothetical protein